MRICFVVSLLVLSAWQPNAQTQQAYLRLGQKALTDGNFRLAVISLEKFCQNDSSNTNALWMLGYSYYHTHDHVKAIATYTRLILLMPKDPASAFYYRGRSRSYVGQDRLSQPADKEKYLTGAIADFSSSIGLEPNDMKSYQNRGIAYQEYGKFRMQRNSRYYDRRKAVSSLQASISDFETVQAQNPGRRDMTALLERSRELLGKVR